MWVLVDLRCRGSHRARRRAGSTGARAARGSVPPRAHCLEGRALLSLPDMKVFQAASGFTLRRHPALDQGIRDTSLLLMILFSPEKPGQFFMMRRLARRTSKQEQEIVN